MAFRASQARLVILARAATPVTADLAVEVVSVVNQPSADSLACQGTPASVGTPVLAVLADIRAFKGFLTL